MQTHTLKIGIHKNAIWIQLIKKDFGGDRALKSLINPEIFCISNIGLYLTLLDLRQMHRSNTSIVAFKCGNR